jgi:hypothetical protein
VIEVDAAGQVRFYEIGAKGPINDSRTLPDRAPRRPALHDHDRESGVVDLVGDTLVYYKDVYQRRRPTPPSP